MDLDFLKTKVIELVILYDVGTFSTLNKYYRHIGSLTPGFYYRKNE